MSPASISKSKDKQAGKDPHTASSNTPGPANAASGITPSAYNQLSGMFHVLETVPTSSASTLHTNGRFRNIDETDNHFSGSLGTGIDSDSLSNNGSWSGESEDHKERTSNPPNQQETVPGAENDKREKIRHKNERKHQRQKERRAHELHERCTGYLMSRKLEALAQQLVAMGFPHERATMALILNEGKVEESVSWLFDGGEDADMHSDHNFTGGNLKIDISEEFARIADMEVKYKCTKQEVERAVVASEGDLEKAAESVRALKVDLPSAPPKPEETSDPPTSSNCKLLPAVGQNVVRPQPKPNSPPIIQQKRDEKDFNCSKAAVPVGESSESGSKSSQPSKRMQPKLDWGKSQQTAVPADKRSPSVESNPSVSYSSLTSSFQASPLPSRTETRFVALGSEYKNLWNGTVREPVIMMQRPQSVNIEQVPATSISFSPPGTAACQYAANSVDIMKSNALIPHIPDTGNLSLSSLGSNQMFHQLHYQQQQHFVPGTSPGDSQNSRRNDSWNRKGASPTLAVASSLGLFSGLGSSGSSGSSSPVGWGTTGSIGQLDYTNIDWSLDRGLSSSSPCGLCLRPGSLKNGSQMCDSSASGLGAKLSVRTDPSKNGMPIPGLQDWGVANVETSVAGSHEWTSPFEGKDLFRLPRQYVPSSSM